MLRIQKLIMFLSAHFGDDVELHNWDDGEAEAKDLEQGETQNEDPSIFISLDEADARINLATMVRFSCQASSILCMLMGASDSGKFQQDAT